MTRKIQCADTLFALLKSRSPEDEGAMKLSRRLQIKAGVFCTIVNDPKLKESAEQRAIVKGCG